jgi:valyl-tRNA synthetase
MDLVQAVITAARTIRSERDVPPRTEVPLELHSDDESVRALLEAERVTIETLFRSETLVIAPRGGERAKGTALSAAAGVEVLVQLRGIVDASSEMARVEREVAKTEKDVAALEKKLSAKGFAERAPKEVVEQTREQLALMKQRLVLLAEARQLAGELGDENP